MQEIWRWQGEVLFRVARSCEWGARQFFLKIAAFIAAFFIARALVSGPFGTNLDLASKATSSGPLQPAPPFTECG